MQKIPKSTENSSEIWTREGYSQAKAIIIPFEEIIPHRAPLLKTRGELREREREKEGKEMT